MREEGYYWVKNWYDEWTVARWRIKELTGQGHWEKIGFEDEYTDSIYKEINETKLIPPQ